MINLAVSRPLPSRFNLAMLGTLVWMNTLFAIIASPMATPLNADAGMVTLIFSVVSVLGTLGIAAYSVIR